MELASHILKVLQCRKISLSEAGVGIGKTYAYLIAATIIKHKHINDFRLRCNYQGRIGKHSGMRTEEEALPPHNPCRISKRSARRIFGTTGSGTTHNAEMPVVVATSSIALQKAIASDYIPEISNILMKYSIIKKPLTCVIRKGKEHYICDKRLHMLWRQSTYDNDKQLLEPLVIGGSSIDLGEMDFLKPYIKRRINVTGRCGKNCSMRDSCRYIAFLKDAQSDKYDFQISNQNYFLADIKLRSKGQRPLIPDYQAVIIDEAHKLLQAARQIYGTELSNHTIPHLTKTVRSFVFLQGQSTTELIRCADKLESQSKRLFRILVENVPVNDCDDEAERFQTTIDSNAERKISNIHNILGQLIELLENRIVLQKYENQYSHILCELRDISDKIAAFTKHDNLICWLEKPEGDYLPNNDEAEETLLCAIPKQLSNMLHTDLWEKGIPIVLTSGTLSASGDFTHIKLGLGLDKLKPSFIIETSKPSPYDYCKNALIYISNTVPFPNIQDKRYVTAVTSETERLIAAAHGHSVVLFTSYRMMEMVYDLLKRRCQPFPLFMLGKGGINAIEQYRQSGNGVLLATGSMWEGVDLPGDILSMLIIVKLPFAVPDPISEYEQTQFKDIEIYINTVIVPEMLVKFKQGFGRLLRSESDTGVVSILDSRVREGGAFRDRVLRALPDCSVTSNIKAVQQFIIANKKPEYYNSKYT